MRWLVLCCSARVAFATMFSAYSAVLPQLKHQWAMTAWQAGLIPSACHVDLLISLFCLGFLSGRHGAQRIYLASSFAAVIRTPLFAFFANGFWSGLLLYGSHRTDHLGLGELLGPWAIWRLRKCRKHGPLAGGKR